MSGEALEVSRHVVDEIVRVKNALVSAEDEACGREKGKVTLQPAELRAEGIGKLHGRCGDEDFVTMREPLQHALAVRHHVEILKEIFFLEVAHQTVLAAGWKHVDHPVAPHILNGEVLGKLSIVETDEFAHSIGEYLIHVDSNTLHAVCAPLAPPGRPVSICGSRRLST